ncbi:MAG: hypothetical protein AVDCRST_MAG89-3514, partial [uncultured Gemmatimonadetes bacterium]
WKAPCPSPKTRRRWSWARTTSSAFRSGARTTAPRAWPRRCARRSRPRAAGGRWWTTRAASAATSSTRGRCGRRWCARRTRGGGWRSSD